MPNWKNTKDNQESFLENNSGKLTGKVGHILEGELISADSFGSVLRLTKNTLKAKAGQYVYKSPFIQVFSTPQPPPPPPPPPPPTGKTVTHTIIVYSDGSISIDGNPYP